MKIATDVFYKSALIAQALILMAMPARLLHAGDSTSPSTRPVQANAVLERASLELLASVQKNLRDIDALEANFNQEKNLAIFKHKVKLAGHFALKKPDWVIWVVDKPVRYAIRVQGEEVRQWDEDTKKVQTIHLGGDPTFKAVSEQLQAWFLGNYKALESSYDVYVLGKDPVLSLRFVPKASTMIAKLIRHIDVTFAKDGRNIENMIVQETSGDWTNLMINNPKINQTISPQTWEIPPK